MSALGIESDRRDATTPGPRRRGDDELNVTRVADDWVPICAVDDIPILGSRVVQRAHGSDIAIFRNSEDRVFALLDRCPHKGGPLSQGIVFGERVACPLHNWTIELDSGCAMAPDEGCTRRFGVKVRSGTVHLEVAALNEASDADERTLRDTGDSNADGRADLGAAAD